MKAILRWFWRRFPALRKAFGNKVREAMLDDPTYAARFLPYLREQSSYLVESVPPRSGSQLPVPPQHLWWGYGRNEEQYLTVGKGHVGNMSRILDQAGHPLASCNRILDLGAASGIMIRWLADIAERGEVWGVDISGAHMLWCQQHLSPPFRFATTTGFPHLPFEDNYFDLIYAGSVFSHTVDLAEAWLLELKRITRPGGKIYLTVHDEHTLEFFQGEPAFWLQKHLLNHDQELQFSRKQWDFFTINRMPGFGGPVAEIFYRRDYLRRHWGRYLKVCSITEAAYWHQSGVLLEK